MEKFLYPLELICKCSVVIRFGVFAGANLMNIMSYGLLSCGSVRKTDEIWPGGAQEFLVVSQVCRPKPVAGSCKVQGG